MLNVDYAYGYPGEETVALLNDEGDVVVEIEFDAEAEVWCVYDYETGNVEYVSTDNLGPAARRFR